MSHLTYKVLIVDNDHHETSWRLPQSRKVLETKVIKTIEGALAELDPSLPSYLNKNVVNYGGEPQHDYDIVLLDFEMEENKLKEDKSGFVSFEFPLGAVSLQPIFLLGFRRSGKLGSCIVQTYSKVMWDRCPKAAAVTHVVHNLLSNQPLKVIHDGAAGSVDIASLIKARAESIIDALPFSAIGELKLLLEKNVDELLSHNLPNVAAQLQVDAVTLGDLRPDSIDHTELREWLERILRNKGFAYEAYRAFKLNRCIDFVSHAFTQDELQAKNISPIDPRLWIDSKDSTLVTAQPEGKYHVCPEIIADLRSFDVSLMAKSQDRATALHRIFRMWLSAEPCATEGFMLHEALTHSEGHLFSPLLAGWVCEQPCAVYVHRICLHRMFVALLTLVTGVGLGDANAPLLIVYTNKEHPVYSRYVFFIVPQRRTISSSDAHNIQEGLRTPGKWDDLGSLLDAWGSLELWGRPDSYAVSKHSIRKINEQDTPYLDNELLQAIEGSSGAIVLVLPRR